MKRKAALFTIVRDEPIFLPIWERYYTKYFDACDIYILDNQSSDPTTLGIAKKYNRLRIYNETVDYFWLTNTAKEFQKFLLQSYEYVLYTDCDEIIFTNPEKTKLGLRDYINFTKQTAIGSQGFELVHDTANEPKLDLNSGILNQRHYIHESQVYSKTLLSKTPLEWAPGFHTIENIPETSKVIIKDLILIHLHRMDFDLAWQKCQYLSTQKWGTECIEKGAGYQNRISDIKEFEEWFYNDFHDGRPFNPEMIPASWLGLI
jgi:hypothetical protein